MTNHKIHVAPAMATATVIPAQTATTVPLKVSDAPLAVVPPDAAALPTVSVVCDPCRR